MDLCCVFVVVVVQDTTICVSCLTKNYDLYHNDTTANRFRLWVVLCYSFTRRLIFCPSSLMVFFYQPLCFGLWAFMVAFGSLKSHFPQNLHEVCLSFCFNPLRALTAGTKRLYTKRCWRVLRMNFFGWFLFCIGLVFFLRSLRFWHVALEIRYMPHMCLRLSLTDWMRDWMRPSLAYSSSPRQQFCRSGDDDDDDDDRVLWWAEIICDVFGWFKFYRLSTAALRSLGSRNMGNWWPLISSNAAWSLFVSDWCERKCWLAIKTMIAAMHVFCRRHGRCVFLNGCLGHWPLFVSIQDVIVEEMVIKWYRWKGSWRL